MKDSGRPAPGRFVSSSDSGDMAGVVMVPFPSLTKRGSSDSAICSLESCSSPDLQASGREARQQKQKGRALPPGLRLKIRKLKFPESVQFRELVPIAPSFQTLTTDCTDGHR